MDKYDMILGACSVHAVEMLAHAVLDSRINYCIKVCMPCEMRVKRRQLLSFVVRVSVMCMMCL